MAEFHTAFSVPNSRKGEEYGLFITRRQQINDMKRARRTDGFYDERIGSRMRNIIGWSAVTVTLLFSGFWAYWGAAENFHEGWYYRSLTKNLLLFLFQYLSVPVLFVVPAVFSLTWKTAGLFLHLAAGVFFSLFFSGAKFRTVGLLLALPAVISGFLYYFGKPEPIIWAYITVAGIPVLIIAAVSVPGLLKISRRTGVNDDGAQTVPGNGVTLIWAPKGPGRPGRGTTWDEARRVCRYLSADGSSLAPEEQNIWRLPSADEAVRSMAIHGENAGGVWDAPRNKAFYKRTPDKEPPLWDRYSPVIYYWTADTDERDGRKAKVIVYHGGVYPKMKNSGQDSLSFRAVRDVPR